MQYSEIIQRVRERTGVTSDAEAESVTGATLQTLAERLAGGEPKDLASQLPTELKGYVNVSGMENVRKMGPDEFVRQVADRAQTQRPVGEQDVQAVMSVISEAVTPGEMEDIRGQLGSDYSPLFAQSSI